MTINISTPDTVAVRFAGALYGIALSNTDIKVVNSVAATSGNINSLLNSVYTADFGLMSTTTVGTTVAANLGLTGALATAAAGYIAGQLNAAAPGTQGQTISSVLNMFGQLTADATWGAAATAWETSVAGADIYANNAANTTRSTMGAAATTGTTQSLTTGLDALLGTANNDTFIADNTPGTNNVTGVADSINGGGGTDTLKVYLLAASGAIDALNMPSLTSVENVYINSGVLTSTKSFDASSLTGVTSLALDTPVAMLTTTSFTIKEAATQSLSLTKLNVAAAGTATLSLTGVTSLTASGVGTDTTNTGVLTIDGGTTTATTSLALNVTGADTFTLTNTGAKLATLTVSGSAALSLTESLGTLTTVNASAETAAVTLDVTGATLGATFAFTGGSANDTLKLKLGALSLLTSGAQLNGGGGTDTVVILDTAPATADYAALNASTGFEVLGIGANATTIDASKLTGAMATHYSIGAQTTETINNISNGTVVDLTGAIATSVTLAPLVGQNVATVNLNTDTTVAGITVASLVTSGLSTPSIVSNGTSVNTLTSLTVTANSSTTITGADALTVTTLSAGGSGDAVVASAFTGALIMGVTAAANVVATLGVGTSGKGDVISLGSGTSTIVAAATLVGDHVNLLAGHTKIDTLDLTKITTAQAAAAYANAAAQLTGAELVTNFNTGATASDVLKVGIAAANVAVGVAADINATGSSGGYTVTNGFATKTGATATSFLADVFAANTLQMAGHVVAFNDGTNTWVADFTTTSAGKTMVIELVGVNTATALGTVAAANTIHLA